MNYIYRTTKGKSYSFTGWNTGESPIERFEKKEWLQCLHGCMLIASFLPSEAARLLLEDDQLLHELLHLAQGVELSTHGLAGIKRNIKKIQKRFQNEQIGRLKGEEATYS